MCANAKRDYFAYVLLLGIGVIWGSQFLFNAKAIQYFPPATIAASRVLIGALTLTVASYFLSEKRGGRTSPSIWLLLVAVAFFEVVLPLFLIVWGQQHVESSITAVIVGSVPIVTLVLSVFLSEKKHFTLGASLSVILGLIGIIILVKPSGNNIGLHNLIYEFAIFAGVVSFALALILFEKVPRNAPIRSVRNILWIASLPLIFVALIFDKPWNLSWNFDGVIALLILGVMSSGLAYVIYAMLIHRRGPVFTSISNFIVPLVGVLLGVGIRGEHFDTKEVLAVILIISALALHEMDLFSKLKFLGKKK